MADRLPIGIPKLLPEGTYKFKITDVKETPSTFGAGSYWRIFFIVRSEDGEHFDFVLPFTQKMDRYNAVLDAIGVKPNEKGFRVPPNEVVGKEFMGKIIQRRAINDKSKTVNDIEELKPCTPAEVDVAEPVYEPEEEEADIENDIPDGLK